MDGEGAPLGGAGVKIVIVHVQVTRADRLRTKSVEEGHFGPAGDAHCPAIISKKENVSHHALRTSQKKIKGGLTVGIFQRLLLFGRLRNDFDPLAVEHADILAVAVEHFHRQHEMFALVRVGDEERLGRAITLF